MKTHYFLNLEKINGVMQERNISIKQLVEGSDISEKRLKRYLQGKVYKNIPISIGVILRTKLDLTVEEMLTTIPPKTVKPLIGK